MDPDIPEDDRRRIVGNERLAFRGAVPQGRGVGALVVAGCLALDGLLGRRWLPPGLAFMMTGGGLVFIGAALVHLVHGRQGSPQRLMRRYGERYVVPADLDAEAHSALFRAGQAVQEVYASRVHRTGLLDPVANDVVLPRQLWEIARLLRSHSILRAEQRQAAQGVVTPELRAVLDPQRAALARSVTAVERRVAMLEAYARRVQEADAALRAQDLLGGNDKYRALLARTDDMEGLRDLTLRADAVEGTLARSVQDAVAAGHTLATLPDGL
ncbi:hypothetical protein [Sphaerisporangium rufum]|uniref:hypothetical protein n=1 Tax=Sphaerisporangium rufum TaxID=1381558 RepID=UPI00194E2CF1|nr:hypothetical protein [Sphaerisporangium rufum]